MEDIAPVVAAMEEVVVVASETDEEEDVDVEVMEEMEENIGMWSPFGK